MVFDKLFNVICKSQRGQLSIEFILILLVIIILISAIVLPLRDYAESSVSDIIAVQTLEKGLSDLEQTVVNLQNYTTGKLNVVIHIPEKATLSFIPSGNDLNVSYVITLNSSDMNSGYKSCTNSKCTKQIILKYVSTTLGNIVGPQDLSLFVVKDISGIKINK